MRMTGTWVPKMSHFEKGCHVMLFSGCSKTHAKNKKTQLKHGDREQMAHSRESDTFSDFREKISFFIEPHK